MAEVVPDAVRTIGPADGIPNDFVVPYYLDDRKRRVSIARVGGRLYAFDALCTCPDRPCPLSGGLLTGPRSCASATAPGSTSPREP